MLDVRRIGVSSYVPGDHARPVGVRNGVPQDRTDVKCGDGGHGPPCAFVAGHDGPSVALERVQGCIHVGSSQAGDRAAAEGRDQVYADV